MFEATRTGVEYWPAGNDTIIEAEESPLSEVVTKK
jgi:hypothetical protein